MRNATEEIRGGMESEDADAEGKHTSGISEMDAITRRVVLELESLKP